MYRVTAVFHFDSETDTRIEDCLTFSQAQKMLQRWINESNMPIVLVSIVLH